MGEEKYKVVFNGKELLEYPLDLARRINADEMIVVGNKSQQVEGHFTFVHDQFDEVGPLGGILSGLAVAKNDINVVLSCDTPFVSTDLIKFLLDSSSDFEIVLPEYQDRIHPLIGVYNKSIHHDLKQYIKNGGRKVLDFVVSRNFNVIQEGELKEIEPLTFTNLNTKKDIIDNEG